MVDMPIKMSTYWKILEIITFFFLICIFLFLRHSEKYRFGFSCDRQIKTIHCSHNYLEWSLNSKFKLKLFELESRFFANIWENIVKIPYFSFLRMQWPSVSNFPLECSMCVNYILFFLAVHIFSFWQTICPKRKSSILTNCDGQFPAFLRLHGMSRRQL